MRRAALLLLTLILTACGGESGPKPLSEPGEKLYDFTGRIVSRDTSENTLKVDHEAIPGFMEAMTMDFSVRGADVANLPADGARIRAKLHVTDRAYWLTEVTAVP